MFGFVAFMHKMEVLWLCCWTYWSQHIKWLPYSSSAAFIQASQSYPMLLAATAVQFLLSVCTYFPAVPLSYSLPYLWLCLNSRFTINAAQTVCASCPLHWPPQGKQGVEQQAGWHHTFSFCSRTGWAPFEHKHWGPGLYRGTWIQLVETWGWIKMWAVGRDEWVSAAGRQLGLVSSISQRDLLIKITLRLQKNTTTKNNSQLRILITSNFSGEKY